MNRAIILLVGLLLIVVVFALVMGQSLLVVQRLARVSSVSGSVQVKTPGGSSFIPLRDQALVTSGAVVQTGPGGSATLNWIDGSRLLVGPATTMTVLKCQVNRDTRAETSLFNLTTGNLLVRVRKLLSGQSKFEIRTPTATAGVRGTIFSVQVSPAGQTQIAVLEGQVNLDAAGQTLSVTPGYRAIASADKAEVQRLSAAERARLEGTPGALGPYVALDQPLAGATVAPGLLEVSGQVEERARLTLNGEPVRDSKLNRFRTTVQVPAGAGSFTLRVVAIDERDYRTEITREVRVGSR